MKRWPMISGNPAARIDAADPLDARRRSEQRVAQPHRDVAHLAAMREARAELSRELGVALARWHELFEREPLLGVLAELSAACDFRGICAIGTKLPATTMPASAASWPASSNIGRAPVAVARRSSL